MKKLTKRQRIKYRVRKKITGTPDRPRLSVFRSNTSIYCQVIDDLHGHTIVAASSREDGVDREKSRKEQAKEVGKLIAERAKQRNIDTVVFDRSGYIYHGRVRALAEGARENGLRF